MKPKNIFIVRHGESMGNIDKKVYSYTPDYAVLLIDKGKEQAEEAGKKIKLVLQDDIEALEHYSSSYDSFINSARDLLGVYYSSYFRARQTMDIACGQFEKYHLQFKREDPRLREQEWVGNFSSIKTQEEIDKLNFGIFYYRYNGGESGADVYSRISTFWNELDKDFSSCDYPENITIFGHGYTNRILLMKILGLTVEEFERIKNPKNGEVWILSLNESGKYDLISELESYQVTHKWKYPY